MNLLKFSPNWFDMLLMLLMVIGLVRGRKRGMSEELLDVLQWLLVVVASALVYKPLGEFISSYTHIQRLFGYLWCYLFCVAVIYIVFKLIKRAVGEKLVGSDIFGNFEYYLGMVAGMLRYFCVALVAMALLNAYFISPAALAAQKKKQKETYGSGISFPSLGTIQEDVFRLSTFGPLIRKHLGDQLIESTPYIDITVKREGFGKKLENEVNEAIDDLEKKKK
jgi:uncharacterized membrane protein required for colicin V production